jgi:hypothetical protein
VGSGKDVILLEMRGWRLEIRQGADLVARWKDLIVWRRFTGHGSTGVHRRQMGTCVEWGRDWKRVAETVRGSDGISCRFPAGPALSVEVTDYSPGHCAGSWKSVMIRRLGSPCFVQMRGSAIPHPSNRAKDGPKSRPQALRIVHPPHMT